MNSHHHWLNRERITVYPRLFVALFLLISIAWVLLSKNMVDFKGKPLGYDFITFWAASYLGLKGHAADAYNILLLAKIEKIAVPASQRIFAWYYPPAFFLTILPLALLPYLAAYWTFILSTLGAYLFVWRRIIRGSIAMWCMAGFSGLWMNLLHGQNAFLTAALAAGALLCLDQQPILAGIFVGLLAIKPHLALLFPVALIAIGAWRSFVTAAVTALVFTAAGVAVLGTGTVKACWISLSYARSFLEKGILPWVKMPTVFALLRLLGTPVAVAYTIHAIIALGATSALWRVWRNCNNWPVRSAALMTATFLISPYVFDYDLAWLAFPIAWMALEGLKHGWLRGEREVLVAAWVLPMLMSPIANVTSVQIGPLVGSALLYISVRRAAIHTNEKTRSHANMPMA